MKKRKKNYKLKETLSPEGDEIVLQNKQKKFTAHQEVLPETELKQKTLSYWWWVLFGSLFIIGLIFTYLFSQIQAFEAKANKSVFSLLATAKAGMDLDWLKTQKQINILLLGIDTLENRKDAPPLTDTIMLLNIGMNGDINGISLPRDLYIAELKLKINSLYESGILKQIPLERSPAKTVLATIIDQPIQKIMVIDLNTVSSLIDAIGGLSVDVDRSFIDKNYPKDNVNLETTKDPNILYETIEFKAGLNIMDGRTALKFIRSRHSEDLIEGTDDARILRQQKVIFALKNKLLNDKSWISPNSLGSLYRLYKEQIKTDLKDEELVDIGSTLMLKPISIQMSVMPTELNSQQPLLTNPPLTKYGAWVWEPIDNTFGEIKDWVAKQWN